ncbi:cysteine desulfurase [Pontimonas sp.]|nr:cysteine desulfurase [Pontimonas sp.]
MSVYLDHQATSPMPQAVKEAYLDALGVAGNPSALHGGGRAARALLEQARERVAAVVGAHPTEVIFTSGGTEAINTALKGSVWEHQRQQGARSPAVIAATRAEHHATLDAITWLVDQEGAQRREVAVDHEAVMELDSLQEALDSGGVTIVTTLLANNEVGSYQPVTDIAERSRSAGASVHVDAVAAAGYGRVAFSEMGVDALSVSAHKLGGPVGTGALILSRQAPTLQALHHGGNQQRSRSGTMDVAGAVAMAAALEVRAQARQSGQERLAALRDRLREGLLADSPQIVVRGSLSNRLPGNLHITVPGCTGEVLLFLCDQEGIQVSTGSACQAGVPEPSHVLSAMGVPPEDAWGALRLTLGYTTSAEDVEHVIRVFPSVVERATQAGLAGVKS